MRSSKLILPLLGLLLCFVAVGYNYLSDRAAGRGAGSSLCLAVFLGIVVLSLLWGSSGVHKRRRLQRLAEHAQARGRAMKEPWLARPEWRSGEITLDRYNDANFIGIALIGRTETWKRHRE